MLSSKQQIGKLDRRITIQQKTTTKDSYNQDIETWSTFRTVWADVQDEAGSEAVIADQPTALRTTKMIIRYIAGMSESTMRIKYASQYYNIVGIQRPDRMRTLILRTALLDDLVNEDGGGFSATAFSSGFRTA